MQAWKPGCVSFFPWVVRAAWPLALPWCSADIEYRHLEHQAGCWDDGEDIPAHNKVLIFVYALRSNCSAEHKLKDGRFSSLLGRTWGGKWDTFFPPPRLSGGKGRRAAGTPSPTKPGLLCCPGWSTHCSTMAWSPSSSINPGCQHGVLALAQCHPDVVIWFLVSSAPRQRLLASP